MARNIIKSLFLFTLFASLMACSSLPDQKNIDLRAEQTAQKSPKSSQFFLQQAKSKLQKSHIESLAFYAPTYLEQAQNAYDEASALYLEKTNSDKVKRQAQLSIELIEAGLRNKKMVKEYLPASLANRQVLSKLNAAKYFPQAAKDIDNSHIELIKLIEQREEIKAQKNEQTLLRAMRNLEVATLGQIYLSKSYTMLAQANDLGVQKNLPNLYQQTLSELKKTENFIQQNPRDKKNISGLAQDNLFNTERLFSLARLAQKIAHAKEGDIETLIIKQEGLLQTIATAIGYKDISNVSMQDQALLLSQYAKKLKSAKHVQTQTGNDTQELERWKRKVVLLQAEIRRLEKQSGR